MRSKNILVVEDDWGLRSSLLDALAARGYQAEGAGSLRQGLQLAADGAPDVIVSDVHLEDGDGRDLLEALKVGNRLQDCQFVLMTGDLEGTSQRTGMNLGADDYLAKPFSIRAFLECIETRLRKQELQRGAEERVMRMMRDSVSLTVPHEFLTPLNGIIGLSDFLMAAEEETPAEVVRELASDINECGTRLLRTVRNYLTILDVMEHPAAAAAIAEEVSSERVNESFAKVAATLGGLYKRQSDLQAERPLPDGLELRLNIDRFETVLREALDNAFKFSRSGSLVKVAMALSEETLLLSVEDDGCGMTRDQVRRIGAFHQFDRKRYAQQGLGLGLTLAQQLLARDGGGLRIESEAGSGTLLVAHWPQ